MGKDPAFLFYFQDFAFGTRRLTRREKGAYLDLLIEQADLFSKDEKYKMQLSHIQLVLSSDFDVWEKIKEKFEEKNGFFWNKKLEEVQNDRRNFSLSRKNNRLGKTKNKQVNNTSCSSDKLVEDENVNENEIKNKESKNKKNIYLDCVKLTDSEHVKLLGQFGEEKAQNLIQQLNDYIMSKGTRYKSHYHTILNWSRRDSHVTQKNNDAPWQDFLRIIQAGTWRTPDKIDARIKNAVQQIGCFSDLSRMTTKQLEFKKSEFMSAYNA